MTTMTLRGIDETLAEALKELARSQGVSLNALTLRLIREATGVDKRKRTLVHNDLDTLAGTWSKDDEGAFLNATQSFGTIDKDMWK
jgi:hypothetical protein